MTDIERQVKALANANWLNGFIAGYLAMGVITMCIIIFVR